MAWGKGSLWLLSEGGERGVSRDGMIAWPFGRTRKYDGADSIDRSPYTDLPHMMREFKRYHSMNIREAREMAYW
ncbi:MAG: hypothetical protein HFH84_15570 [Lachnospiraceae bacterium]|jgi:AraC-like DNA-binding protein|nr:hypothetical protein [Lachnospiraceae bacterium]